jgi:4,5-dihydroxyphthalate decarboxylase
MWCRAKDSLAARMLKGEFDAIIVPDFPEEKGWRRLFIDSKTVEQEFFSAHADFPDQPRDYFSFLLFGKISGCGAGNVRRLSRSKKSRLRDDADATYSNFAWNRQVWEEQQAVMGADPWKFGIKGNEKALDALIRYADEQGLLAKKMTIADLFLQIDEPQS